jgi:hypothetical protein
VVTAAPLTIDAITKERISGMFMMPDFTAEVPLMAWNQIGTCGE